LERSWFSFTPSGQYAAEKVDCKRTVSVYIGSVQDANPFTVRTANRWPVADGTEDGAESGFFQKMFLTGFY
jgi:hypothetical protein